jgi:hypothetical protein
MNEAVKPQAAPTLFHPIIKQNYEIFFVGVRITQIVLGEHLTKLDLWFVLWMQLYSLPTLSMIILFLDLEAIAPDEIFITPADLNKNGNRYYLPETIHLDGNRVKGDTRTLNKVNQNNQILEKPRIF